MKKHQYILCCIFASIVFFPRGRSQTLKVRDTIPDFRHVDTVNAFTENCRVVHYYEYSNAKLKYMRSMHDNNNIFDSSINGFSKMFIYRSGYENPIELSTIPLDNIIVLEDKELIIGLSKIDAAPYKIVIYRFNGELVYKGNLGYGMLKISYDKLKTITQKFPELIAALKTNGNVIKKDNFYYVELTNDIKHILGSDFRKKYFPNELLSTENYLPFQTVMDGGSITQYKRVRGGYLSSSPYSSLIVINDVPYVLVLNNVDGGKSYIPLVSNCNIEKELSR